MDRDGDRRGLDLTTTARTLPRAIGGVLFAAAVVVPLVRNGGIPAWDTIWIEDAVFAQEANQAGPAAVLLRAYSGYLQLLTRILAIPTAILPASWIAGYLAVAASLVCALLAAFVYRQTAGLVGSVAARLVIAAMVVLSPAMAVETTATITNTIWVVLAAAPFAFLSRRDGPADTAMRAVVAFLAATATALSFLFVPLAIAVALRRRSRAAMTVLSVYVVGLVLQLLVVRVSDPGPRAGSSMRILADLFGLRVLGSFLMGERPLDRLWSGVGELAVVVLYAVVIAGFAYLLRGAGRRNQRLAAVLLACAVGAFVLPALGRGTDDIGFALGVYSLNMTRYTVGPIVLLVTAVAVLVAPGLEPRARPLPFDGAKVFVVWSVVVLAAGLLYPTVRGQGPGWRSESARVRDEACASAPPDRLVEVTTTPRTFTLALTCARLAS